MNPANRPPVDPIDYPGYWHEKKPCWVLLGCPATARARCDAFLRPATPCWEHHATLCEEVLRVPKNCQLCIVYKAYHYQDPFDESAYPE